VNGVISGLKMGLIGKRIFFSFIYGVITGLRRRGLIGEREIKTTVWTVENNSASVILFLRVCFTVGADHFFLFSMD